MRRRVLCPWQAVAVVAVVLSCAAAPEPACAANTPYLVIVHPSNPTSTAFSQWLSEAFRKKKTRWDHGAAIEPVDLSGESEVREAFSTDVHGKSTENIRSYWNQEVFSGRSTPPPELASSSAVVDYVRTHAGAIGYVSPRAAVDGVKVLSVFVSPRVVQRVEPEYPAAASARHFTGEVVLEVEVLETGSVGTVTAVKELGMGLTSAAINAVRRWKFAPGKRDGVPLAQKIQITVTFALR